MVTMRRLLMGSVIVLLTLLSAAAAFACGDKLLAIGRGIRFQRTDAAHHANILIYSAAPRAGASLDGPKLRTALQKSVRNMEIVHTDSQLDQALKSRQVDVVLVYFEDLAGVARQLQSAPSRPVILPVLIKPTKDEFAAAQKQYKFVLRAGADEFEYLIAIDEAMKTKLRAKAKS